MSFPQLRVRSGYSFKYAYGKESDIIDRLKEIGCGSAAMVDNGTWGNVKWEKAATKAEIVPMFGAEIPIKYVSSWEDEGPVYGPHRPKAWILAQDTKAFYRATSAANVNGGLDADEFSNIPGVIRFAGGAVGCLAFEAAQYDYIDINPSSLLHAAAGVRAHRQTGAPLVITSYNDMPSIDHRNLAYAWTVRESVGMRHIADEGELWSVLQRVMTPSEFTAGVNNAIDIADRLRGIKLAQAPLIHTEGDLVQLCRYGKAYRVSRGHIAEWTPEYEARLVRELEQIQSKDFDSYFLVVADLIQFAKERMLVGPGRGSSAGSLVCYLMGITEVDPIPPKLLFERFLDVSRSDMPDIDIDFSDTKRHLVFDYLQKKFGRENVVKLGSINTLKANSVIAQVAKRFNIPFHDTDAIKTAVIDYPVGDSRYGHGLEDTFDTTGPGDVFAEKWPSAAKCMAGIELHPSHSGVHAAGIVVCNDNISDYCTVNAEGVAQIDKPDAEYLNLLKIDALGLRTLGVIEDAGVLTNQELYDLRMDDPLVLGILNADKMSGVFQFEGQAVRTVANEVDIDVFSKIDHITALARPGPLSSGMVTKYIDRVSGREPVSYFVPQLKEHLSDTFGVFIYQEQIMSVVKGLGLFDWEKTSAIRKAMSKSKGAEFFDKLAPDFIAGAVSQGVPADKALKIWEEMIKFGAYCFNKAHSYSYAVVTYWTCYLKCYHKLEFAAASLRSAKDETQTISILRELIKEGVQYQAIDLEHSGMNWKAVEGRIVGGIMNAKGYGPVKARRYIELRDAGKLTEKQRLHLANSEVQFADLAEAHSKWGHFYESPRLAGVTSGMKISEMNRVKSRDECLVIGKLVKKTVGDENEASRLKKRNGKLVKGNSQFLDLMLRDDSTDQPMRFRIKHEKYLEIGKEIAEEDPKGAWYLVKAWKLPDIPMFIIKNIKRIDAE